MTECRVDRVVPAPVPEGKDVEKRPLLEGEPTICGGVDPNGGGDCVLAAAKAASIFLPDCRLRFLITS